jgi:transposase
MDRSWLHEQLADGRSIEAIAREVGRDPSTVAYWVAKYGLASTHAAKHAPRGGIAREQIEPLVLAGLSVRAIGERLGVSYATVRHWLKRYGLRTRRSVEPRRSDARTIERECPIHGLTTFGRRRDGYFRCLACRAEAVVKRRRAVKRILVEEAGGACQLCGYNRVPAALQFHHLDRAEKAFELSHRGATLALATARAEIAKCVLLCANCHAEVEAGAATVR